MLKLKQFPYICLSVFLLTFPLIASFSHPVSADSNSEYREVNLGYLATHFEEFSGQKVRTSGTVHYLVSFYMYEDFWLDMTLPVVIRFANLPKPPENSFIEVCGIIEYSNVEGGFFYLNAQSWTYAEKTMPEFQSLIILPLFALGTLLVVIVYRRKHLKI